MSSIAERRRGLIGGQKDDLTPITALISAPDSPIDTGIIIRNNVVMTVRAKRGDKTNAGYLFYDGITFLKKRNGAYSNKSRAFNEAYEPFVNSTNIKDFIIDGVNHRAQWATNSSSYFTASQFVQATQTMSLAVCNGYYANGYTYYKITAVIDGVLTHDLRPYLKNGKPGFLDIITGDFHTTSDGMEEWDYED